MGWRSYRYGQAHLFAHLEDAPVAGDVGGRAHGLHGIVGELYRRSAVGRHHLADDGERIEPPLGSEPTEIIGEQGAPAIADAHVAMEMVVNALDGVHVQAIGKDQQLLTRVLMAPPPPGDGDLSAFNGVAGIDADAGPTCHPVWRALQKVADRKSTRLN